MQTCDNRKNQMPGNYRGYSGSQVNVVAKQQELAWDADFPIGMCYVPWQHFGDLYSGEIALKQGTIFKELSKEFKGERC